VIRQRGLRNEDRVRWLDGRIGEVLTDFHRSNGSIGAKPDSNPLRCQKRFWIILCRSSCKQFGPGRLRAGDDGAQSAGDEIASFIFPIVRLS
jgi:hypothetical protein